MNKKEKLAELEARLEKLSNNPPKTRVTKKPLTQSMTKFNMFCIIGGSFIFLFMLIETILAGAWGVIIASIISSVIVLVLIPNKKKVRRQ